jgi:hypothetical protein
MTAPQAASAMIPLHNAASQAEVTYRQAHYWAQRGLVTVTDELGHEGLPGSGYPAFVSAREAKVLTYIGLLTGAGLELKRAAVCAREMHEHRRRTFTAENGVKVTLPHPRPEPPRSEDRDAEDQPV